jgi:hypothetical protein
MLIAANQHVQTPSTYRPSPRLSSASWIAVYISLQLAASSQSWLSNLHIPAKHNIYPITLSIMVGIQEVRSELASLKRLGPGLVAVFVGGTNGIGEATAREFVRNTLQPRIYLVGRNQEQADLIKADFQKLNPESQTKFIQGDVSLLRNVDKICDEIKSSEEKINLLVLSAGILSMKGRDGKSTFLSSLNGIAQCSTL